MVYWLSGTVDCNYLQEIYVEVPDSTPGFYCISLEFIKNLKIINQNSNPKWLPFVVYLSAPMGPS